MLCNCNPVIFTFFQKSHNATSCFVCNFGNYTLLSLIAKTKYILLNYIFILILKNQDQISQPLELHLVTRVQ